MTYQWATAPTKQNYSREQLALVFEAIKRGFGESDRLPDIGRIMCKAVKAADKAKTVAAKVRHLSFARDRIDLIMNESRNRYRVLERDGGIDEPDYFWTYVEKAEQSIASLSLKIRHYLEESPPDDMAAIPMLRTVPFTMERPVAGTFPVEEIMDIDGVAAYLKVSKSTIYHLSAAGEIPVSRIGSRLSFRKEDIDRWHKRPKPDFAEPEISW